MRRRQGHGRGARQAALAVALLLLGVAAGWWLAASRRPVPPDQAARPPRPPAARTPAAPPAPHPARPPRPIPASPAAPGIRVAIVFDDAGGSMEDVEEIIAIGRPVTVAVLPGLRYSAEVARRARAAGLEVLLHLPVEPLDGTKALGPGGVTVAMDEAEIQAVVRAGLASVPGAAGVSNHMGSRGTADRRVMRAILGEVRARDLFFLDSVTTAHSVGAAMAAEMGVRTAARTLFLDNENDPEAIRREVRRLIALALQRGEAIAIGHAQRLTPRVVAEMVAEFDRAGITIVPVSSLSR